MSKGIIIIPAYNEDRVIKGVIEGIKKEVLHSKRDLDILIVNDGSNDSTSTVCKNIKGIILISHLINMGSGAATKTGLEYAKKINYQYAVTIDADGQHTTQDLMNVIEKLVDDHYDLVIGSRLLNREGMPLHRVFGNKLLNLITRLLFGVSVTDSQSGLKSFSRDAIEKIDIRSNGFEFCSEIVWRAKQNNLKIIEIPIKAVYTDYSLQKGQNNINALRIIRNLIRHKLREV